MFILFLATMKNTICRAIKSSYQFYEVETAYTIWTLGRINISASKWQSTDWNESLSDHRVLLGPSDGLVFKFVIAPQKGT